jgi:hypothetical protein
LETKLERNSKMRKLLLIGAAMCAVTGTAYAQSTLGAGASNFDVLGQQGGNGATVNNYSDHPTGTLVQNGANSQSSANSTARSSANSNNHVSSRNNNINSATGGKSSATSSSGASNSRTTVSGVGNSNYNAAPGMAMASVGGGGFDCPVVGVGLSGVGMSGGGTGLASWISSDCNRRKEAELLIQMGHPQAAAYLMENSPEVKKALKREADAAPQTAAYRKIPAWCWLPDGSRHANSECQ